MNKVDQLRHHDVAPRLAAATELGAYDEIVPRVSARRRGVCTSCARSSSRRMPEGPAFNPVETVTHLPIEVRLSELVREQALRVTRDELPHSTAVVLDGVEPEDGLTRSGSAIPRRWTAWGL